RGGQGRGGGVLADHLADGTAGAGGEVAVAGVDGRDRVAAHRQRRGREAGAAGAERAGAHGEAAGVGGHRARGHARPVGAGGDGGGEGDVLAGRCCVGRGGQGRGGGVLADHLADGAAGAGGEVAVAGVGRGDHVVGRRQRRGRE